MLLVYRKDVIDLGRWKHGVLYTSVRVWLWTKVFGQSISTVRFHH